MKATPLYANRHPLSQKRRRIWGIPSRARLPWYLARIQRINRLHAWESIALKIALAVPYRKCLAHPVSIWFRLVISLSRSWCRVALYVLTFTLSLIAWMAFLEGFV